MFTFVNFLLLSVLISLLCGFTSVYAAISRSEFLIVTVAHAILAGLAILYYISWITGIEVTDVHVWATMFIIALTVCTGIVKIREHGEKELIYSIIFAVTLSVAALFMSLLPGFLIAKMWAFLTGSILLVTSFDVLLVFVLCLIACSLYATMYREFLLVSYDIEYALATGLPARTLNYLLSILISIVTLVCVYTVGVFVTYAILMIPGIVLIRSRIRVGLAIPLSVLIILASLVLSYVISTTLNVTLSGMCGITLCLIAVLTYLIRVIVTRRLRLLLT
jgi:ABC-type Mn2+/Zn2+ transport system permease subunit